MKATSKFPRLAFWAAIIGLTTIAAAYLAREPILTRIGQQLIRQDTLSRADAIVVLGGGTPMREIEAADLYLAGYAPRLLMTVEGEPPGSSELKARGIPFETGIDLRRRIVRMLGVPDTAVTVLDKYYVNSTKSEAELVRAWVASTGAHRIIAVTSRFHTARASLIFRRELREYGVEVLVHSTANDTFRASDWWKDRDELRNGLFEWQKLAFYYVAYR